MLAADTDPPKVRRDALGSKPWYPKQHDQRRLCRTRPCGDLSADDLLRKAVAHRYKGSLRADSARHDWELNVLRSRRSLDFAAGLLPFRMSCGEEDSSCVGTKAMQ